jgi:iron complex outermembrane receptor protein
MAADPVDLGTVQTTTSGTGGGMADDAKIDTAPYQAPSQTPLDVTQPTSIVSQHFIENSVVQVGNYDDAIKFTPSFTNVEPNGPGLQESKFINMRGFQDGQYNLTYDGIPLAGSPTSFHHESAVYFMEHDLGGVQLDRGPGTAGTLGNATFGGTINLLSKDPSATMTGGPYGTFGSFDTALQGTELDTGSIKELNGASFIGDVEHLTSGGFLSDSDTRRLNGYAKGVLPIGEDTVVSFVGMANHTRQNVPSGATPDEISQLGYNFGLNNNPNSNNNSAYNYSTYGTDLEYIGVKSTLGAGWGVDNKAYTDFFSHISGSTTNNDDLSGDYKNLTVASHYNVGGQMITSNLNNQILGNIGKQDYRAWGDIFRLSKDIGTGQFRTGFWFDRTDNSYSKLNVDWSAGGQQYYTCTGAAPSTCPAYGAASYELHDWANTMQGYIEGDIKPIDGLTMTPGLKYSYYRMSVNADVDSGTKVPYKGSQSWNGVQPSVNINYVLVPGWSAYAQIAKGFLAPPLNAFFTSTPNTTLAPETTMNYQVGSVWKNDRVTVSGDLYLINFGNYFTSYTDANKDTIFTSAGAATYKGAELEGTYYLGYHLSLYGNATFNSATYANDQWIANAPIGTGALGLIYQDHSGFYGSLIGKAVGHQEGLDSQSNTNAAPTLVDQYSIPGYAYADFAVGYDLKNDTDVVPLLREAKIGLKVNNVLDNQGVIGLAGTDSGSGLPLYWVQPGRSFFGTVEVKF